MMEIDRMHVKPGPQPQWKPIDTAPKDGTRILAYGACGREYHNSIATVKWMGGDRWAVDPNESSEYDPEPCILTHWMPLPEQPK